MKLDLFRGVVPFVAVAEEQSFRAAAKRLGVSPAAVSKSVQALEAELGLSLLSRTTRAVTLTAQGELFFERSRVAVAAMQGAREAIDDSHRAPKGPLALSVPFVAVPLLVPAMARLRARYPALRFTLQVTDALARLSEDGIDVAIRVGVLADSALVAKKLCGTRIVSAASPEYLARRGVPETPQALHAHDCLVLLGPNGKPRPWLFSEGPLPVPPVLLVDHGPTLVDVALTGLGVCQAFDFMLEPLFRSGRLVEVLAKHAAAGPNMYAVCAAGRKSSANVRAALEALAESFA